MSACTQYRSWCVIVLNKKSFTMITEEGQQYEIVRGDPYNYFYKDYNVFFCKWYAKILCADNKKTIRKV